MIRPPSRRRILAVRVLLGRRSGKTEAQRAAMLEYRSQLATEWLQASNAAMLDSAAIVLEADFAAAITSRRYQRSKAWGPDGPKDREDRTTAP